MADVSLVRENTALVMVDFHTDSIGVNSVVRETFERAGEALQAVRNCGFFVAYEVVNFRLDYPEVPDRNLSFGREKAPGWLPPTRPA